jgi:hypothetical protein
MTVGLSDHQIEAAERALGCVLPASLRVFVREHDGAKPEDNTFDLPNNESGVRAFISLIDAPERRHEIDGFPKTGVPVAEDGCGNYAWLRPETGEILFWDHEVEGDGVVIANDFETFLMVLRPVDMDSARVEQAEVIGFWVDPTFKPTFD